MKSKRNWLSLNALMRTSFLDWLSDLHWCTLILKRLGQLLVQLSPLILNPFLVVICIQMWVIVLALVVILILFQNLIPILSLDPHANLVCGPDPNIGFNSDLSPNPDSIPDSVSVSDLDPNPDP